MMFLNSIEFYVVFMLVCFGWYARALNNLCLYLAATYPKEWQKLNAISLEKDKWTGAVINASSSLRTGYFSTIEDAKVQRFNRFRRRVLFVFIAVTAYRMLFNFYLAYSV